MILRWNPKTKSMEESPILEYVGPRSLPEDARIGNQQLREVEGIQEGLKEDPNSPLTEKEKNLIQRAENYQRYKD